MIKKCLLLLLILCFQPVIAGEVEDALNQNRNVVLYLYTQNCGYCKLFAPTFYKLSRMYDKNFTFIKVDADTSYGKTLMYRYRARYVPYVLILNQKYHKAKLISSDCLTELQCVEKEIRKF